MAQVAIASPNIIIFKMLRPLIGVLMAIINSARPAALAMFPSTQNDSDFYQHSENSQFLLPNHFQLQQNTLERMLCNFGAPESSKISICTQEDRRIDAFSLSDDFLAESEDCFYGLHHGGELQHAFKAASEHIFGQSMKQVKLEEQLQPQYRQQQQYKQEQPDCKQEELQCKQEDSAAREQSCHDQTKNIPKNYIKAIFSFILDNPRTVQQLTAGSSVSEERLREWVRGEKRVKRYTIERLKLLWTGECGRAMRVASCYFLRKRAVGYIFGSKVEKKMAHIRHRYKLVRAMGNPDAFSSIK